MGKLATLTRRGFLIGSTAVAGGVAFGTYSALKPLANPNLADLGTGEASFNPWVVISPEKITLITPHGDKGQGVASSQAALIAEELDLDFGQFDISFGKPDAAYYNTGFADESVPFMSTDQSLVAEAMRSVLGGLIKSFGVMQMTGGSTSIPDSFDKLRHAGAVARETLKLAASRETGVPVAQLRTAQGQVLLPDGSARPYTQLAATAATLDPVHVRQLRDKSQWRLIGKPMQRLDMVAKSTGTLEFGIDAQVAGMKHATVAVNPCKGGAVNGYDASAAQGMRGVEAILPITGGVAVVADNTWRAIQAANAIEFDWGSAPYPDEQAQHWEAVAAAFTEANLDQTWRDEGDVEASPGAVVEAEYRSPYVAHQPLEPLNAIVLVTGDKVEVWTGHQVPIFLTRIVAGVTGHDPSQVVFHNFYMGGSFGHRLEFDHIKQTAEIANQMRGTPIKMTYSRETDFAQDYPRHISMARGKGTVAEGRVVSMDLQLAAPSVIASQMGRMGLNIGGPDMQIVAGAWNNPYGLENLRARAYRVPELAPTSSWRAVGAPGAGFAFDCFLDELIHAAGADPMAERIRLMTHEVSRKVLEAAAEMSDWGAPLPAGTGKGVAFVESFGVPVAEVVQVTDTGAGLKIDKVWVACDVGTVVDPVNFENLVQGGVVFGLGHAMNSEITYSEGRAQQENYYDAEGMRMWQCPEIMVRGLENGPKVRGIGEPPVPPAAPALANAIFAATGQRLREMPFHKFVDFV
jgi:isoquinoline 1-oxidoreductase beta subunit